MHLPPRKTVLLLFLPFLCLSFLANAQRVQRPRVDKPTKKPLIKQKDLSPVVLTRPAATHDLDKKKPAVNMKEFRKTPVFSKRQASYSSNFKTPSKSFSMADGSRLNIHFVKSSDGGQSDNIMARQTGTPSETKDGEWKCVTTGMTIDARTTNFGVSDYAKQAAHIFPGAIYTFDNLMNGSFRAQSGARNPIIISTDNKNVNGESYLTIDNPSAATIRSGVAKLYSRFSSSGGNASTIMQVYESYNSADWALKLNAGGSAFGVSLNNSFNSSNKSQRRYLTIDVSKILFTINTLPPDNGFFKNTADETATPNMMFISSVAYGIRILANLEIKFESSSAADEFNAKYKYGLYQANVDLSYIQNNESVDTKINAYVIGGPNTGLITFNKDELIKSLNNIMAKASYQNAQPISYSLCDMAGNVIGSQSATDNFAYRNCVPAGNAPCLVSAYVNVQCGPDGKDKDTHYFYTLYSNQTTVVTPTGNLTPQQRLTMLTLKALTSEYRTSAAYFINKDNNSRFENNSGNNMNKLVINPLTGQHTLDNFFKEGRFRIKIEPNGHDEWQIANLKLTLNFSDGNTKTVQWNNVIMSHQNKVKDFYFKGGANGTLQAIN